MRRRAATRPIRARPSAEFLRSLHRLGPRADDADDHHRRQDLRLVHRDRDGLHRGALCRLPLAGGLPGDELAGPGRCAGRDRPAGRRRAVLRRHRLRLRLAAGLLPDPGM